MNSVIEFISNNETIIMLSLFILIIFLTIVVLITDLINRKKIKRDSKALFVDPNIDIEDAFNENIVDEPTLDYTQDLGIIESVEMNDSVKEKSQIIEEIKYVEEDEELEKTKAQLELKNLKEELIKADIEEKERLKNTAQIIDKEEELSPIDEFEQSQEDNAIISLEQFNSIGSKLYENNELVQYKDEGNEPISIKELEKLYNSNQIDKTDDEIIDVENSVINIDEKNTITNKKLSSVASEFKFKSSPIISPVYGINTEPNMESIALENTANFEKLNEEIRKTNEFLNTLKEFRKTLD
ncbi:MAG: hypothetical protein PUD59_03100 [bacterium]|nr:hypothetical protein [bacterium]